MLQHQLTNLPDANSGMEAARRSGLRSGGRGARPAGASSAVAGGADGWCSGSSRCWCSRSWSLAAWFAWQVYAPGDDGAPVSVTVEQGWGAKQIGDELASKDVVGSSLAFQLWFRVSGGSSQAGTYAMPRAHGRRRRPPTCSGSAPTVPPRTRATPCSPSRPDSGSSRSPTASVRCPVTTAPRSWRSRSRVGSAPSTRAIRRRSRASPGPTRTSWRA